MRTITIVRTGAVLACGAALLLGGVAHAAVPGTVLATLNDPGGAPFDDFGIGGVSISGDTAVVGADGNAGHAYIYVKGSHGWPASPTVTLNDPLGGGSVFGNSVSVHGSVIVVGAYGTNFGVGAAYIYERGPHGWPSTPTVTLSDPGSASDGFGSSVATSGGNEIIVGAWEANSGAGAAYVYTKHDGSWDTTPVATLTDPPNVQFDIFGTAVALSGDTAVVGALNGNAAYVYVKGRHGWPASPAATLADPAGSGNNFGGSVAVDDRTIVVGAGFTNGVNGAAYIYSRGTAGWPATPTATLADPAATPSSDDFGASVAVSDRTIVVGSDSINSSSGAVYTYRRGTAGWPTTPAATLADPAATPGTDFFGSTVAVDGDTAVAGAWGTLGDIGAAYVFRP
jgi:hypothetical protein